MNKHKNVKLDTWWIDEASQHALVSKEELLKWWKDYREKHSTQPSDNELMKFLLQNVKTSPLSNVKVRVDPRTFKKYKRMIVMNIEEAKFTYGMLQKSKNRIVAGTSVRNCASLLHGYLRLASYESTISEARRKILQHNAAYRLLCKTYPDKQFDFIHKHLIVNADTFSCQWEHQVGKSGLKMSVGVSPVETDGFWMDQGKS